MNRLTGVIVAASALMAFGAPIFANTEKGTETESLSQCACNELNTNEINNGEKPCSKKSPSESRTREHLRI